MGVGGDILRIGRVVGGRTGGVRFAGRATGATSIRQHARAVVMRAGAARDFDSWSRAGHFPFSFPGSQLVGVVLADLNVRAFFSPACAS